LALTSDGGDDRLGISGPYEGLRVIIGFLEEAIDGRLQIANAIRRQQHDLRSLNLLLRAVAIRHDRHQTRPIGIAHLNRDPLAHARPSQRGEHTPNGLLC
jgi:hypothetical protein